MQGEQVPEAVEEMLLELVLQRQEGVEGAVPALQLEGLDLDTGVPGGGALGVGEEGGGEAAALAVTGEEGGEPVGEGVLGGRAGEAVENEHEGAVGQGSEPLREAEIVPEAPQDEEGADMEGGQGDGIVGGGGLVAAADFVDAVEVGVEDVLAAEGDDGASQGAAIFPDGFAEVDVFIGAAAGGGADDHGEHGLL